MDAQSQVPVVFIVFERFSVLVWMKIFCFVFAKMKTDTFDNALVWIGPWARFSKVPVTYRAREVSLVINVSLQKSTFVSFKY